MHVTQHPADFKTLSEKRLNKFSKIPAAVMSDVLARGQTMRGNINPLHSSMKICAQARTAECPVGDNSAIRAALSVVEKGQVVVANAQGYESTAPSITNPATPRSFASKAIKPPNTAVLS